MPLTDAQKAVLVDLGNTLDARWPAARYAERYAANRAVFGSLIAELVGLHLEQHSMSVGDSVHLCAHLIDTGQRYSWVREELARRLEPSPSGALVGIHEVAL